MAEQDRSRADADKARDRSMALVGAGAAAVMPPMAAIFHIDAEIGGVPFILIYLFAVWIALIFGAWRLAGALKRTEARSEAAQDADDGAAR